MTFITSSLIYVALLLAASAPVLFMARRNRKNHLAKRFVQAAVAGGMACGLMSAGQSRLISQCEAEGNTSCYDAGADGMKLMVVAVFVAASLLWTYLLWTD